MAITATAPSAISRSRSAGGRAAVMKITGIFARVGIFAQPRQHGRPVHVGHQDVEDDQVGRPARHGGEGLRAAVAAHHHEFRIETERELDHVPHQGIVVDMKNAKRFHAGTHCNDFRVQSSHGNA